MGLENYACMYTLLRIQHICHIFLTDVKREETKKKGNAHSRCQVSRGTCKKFTDSRIKK